MPQKPFKRKLTAILSADVAGDSRLMQDDESPTVATLESYNLNTTLQLNPLSSLPYVNDLAWSWLRDRQYDKAILLWMESFKLNPNCLLAFMGLTAAY